MLELFNGRPASNKGRLDKEIRVYDLLDSLQIEYQRLDHEAAANMTVCAEINQSLQATICKRYFVAVLT